MSSVVAVIGRQGLDRVSTVHVFYSAPVVSHQRLHLCSPSESLIVVWIQHQSLAEICKSCCQAFQLHVGYASVNIALAVVSAKLDGCSEVGHGACIVS